MKGLLLWLIVAQGLDIAETMIAVRHGCHEANVIARTHLSGALAVKAGMTVTVAVTMPFVHREHPKAATWATVLPAASGTFAAAWNARQLTQCHH